MELLLFDFPVQLVEFKHWIHFIIQSCLVTSQIIAYFYLKKKAQRLQDIIKYTAFSAFLMVSAWLAAELAESILIIYMSSEMRMYLGGGVEPTSLKYYLYLSQYHIQIIKSLYLFCSLFSLTFSIIPWLRLPIQELK